MNAPEGPRSDPPSAVKRANRAQLAAMPPDEAQAVVEGILQPRLWKIADPRQLAWPADLADDLADDPADDLDEG